MPKLDFRLWKPNPNELLKYFMFANITVAKIRYYENCEETAFEAHFQQRNIDIILNWFQATRTLFYRNIWNVINLSIFRSGEKQQWSCLSLINVGCRLRAAGTSDPGTPAAVYQQNCWMLSIKFESPSNSTNTWLRKIDSLISF